MELAITVLTALIPVALYTAFRAGRNWDDWKKRRALRRERRVQLQQRKDWLRKRGQSF